ncbi:MAG: phosphatidate cytidylyltransferase [Campylobacterales bacterium]|nr:phosphatidate cytidylyltransferase [Campylobacterales bacterium]
MWDIIQSSGTRIKTGVTLVVALLIIGFIDSFFIMWLLFGVLMMIAIHEAMKLFGSSTDSIYIYASALWVVAFFYPKPEDLVFVIGIVFASILAYTKELDKKIFLPLLYPIASFLFLLSLYNSFGIGSLLWLLVVVAGADVGAYFVGKSIGATKFCQTSPNKTLEGVAGGVLTAAVLGSIFAIDSVGFFTALLISLVVAIASVFGDLFESYLKREADVKDSGDILPGHGGILDRTDGYLFGGIIMLVLLRFIA